ncbi:GNAT family N-acetyltransferase [Micromonospora chersina]|uniref:GNAT family N-acetyltransferase n=1 Tax=Micromonospora chersina TaxID=47854 RepID=UPI003722B92F
MPYVVRRIGREEWRQLRALRLEALRESPTAFGTSYVDTAGLANEAWRQQAARSATSATSATFIAATEDSRWVGMASCAPLEEVPGHAHIYGVYVAPAHRGRPAGLATRLMEIAIRWARDNTDATWLTIGVHEDNHRAQAFYRRIGFTGTGKVLPYPLNPSKTLHIMGYRNFRQTPAARALDHRESL